MSERFARKLLDWWDRHGRKDLPWHHNRTPYRVWVSEIMLQQTQVATVIPYYQRFMARFPDVQALAEAPEDDVLEHWSGLGYYARARNLHQAAKTLVADWGGVFPEAREDLQTLPGIGRSTAAAIRTQALDRHDHILDGNVKRVLARYHGVEGWPGRTAVARALWRHAESHTPHERVRDYTQAIMDLGALVCTRSRPGCAACPLAEDCVACARCNPEAYPGKKPKKTKPEKACWLLLLEDSEGRLLFEKRPPSGIWGGLWSLPEADPALMPEDVPDYCYQHLALNAEQPRPMPDFRHTFSHYHLQIMPLHCLASPADNRVLDTGSQRWLHPSQALGLGLPAPIRKLLG
ncbi:MAG: A/G-specific adenine glycosylase [Oleiphilaceae bacterium]|nr:A/G-specific adenine glycosylase [Oleiphilaceae bacterium]